MFVVIYLNNILIYSKNESEHKQYIRQVLTALKEADLRIKSEKSQFYYIEIKFLSYIITNKDIRINLKKVRVIAE